MESRPLAESDWLALFTEFRALGGIAENICIRDGAHARGVFAIDPTRPVKLHAPDNLLLPVEDVVFENGRFCVAPTSEMGSAEKAWLEHYENTYSWGGGGRRDTEIFFEEISALPTHLREKLATNFGMPFCSGAPSPERLQERFLRSRVIDYNGRDVVMPLIELINYGRGGRYDFTDGVVVKGNFADEVLVTYTKSDAFGVFLGWGFASEEMESFSLSLRVPSAAADIHLLRKLTDGEMVELEAPQGLKTRIPRLVTDGRKIELSFLMLGNRGFPRLSKGVFHRALRDAGVEVADELFELIHHINRTAFIGLIGDLEGLNGPMVTTLRTMCRFQLGAMSFCYGARQV